VREQVLTKARKLYPGQRSVIAARFELARRSAQAETEERKLQCLMQEGPQGFADKLPQLERELQQQLAELDRYEAIIDASNTPTIQPEGTFEALGAIARTAFRGSDGQLHPLLTSDEARLLSMRKGSLDDSERAEVEAHVVHGYNLLKQIPWTRELRNIPEIARDHHEKPNGRGYPAGEQEISLPSRMMAIADVYDALTASDRPYKSAISAELALQILAKMARDGEIDANLFELFVRTKAYEMQRVDCFEY
jgi:hypothetical protein